MRGVEIVNWFGIFQRCPAMPQCYFYATESDFEPVLRFVFDELNCRVFETYSKPEKELREFISFEAVNAISEKRKPATFDSSGGSFSDQIYPGFSG